MSGNNMLFLEDTHGENQDPSVLSQYGMGLSNKVVMSGTGHIVK
jgi:hypothetical protein